MENERPSTVIFLDAENIFLSLHLANRDCRLNVFSLVYWLQEKFGPFQMYVYGHFSSTKGLPPFIRRILDNFPNIFVFETNIDDAQEPQPQEADSAIIAAMSMKAIGLEANANTYKQVIIMSGDGSLFGQAIKAKSLGMKVTIVAASQDNVNGLYSQAGFDIIFLNDPAEKQKFLSPKASIPADFNFSSLPRA